MAIQSVKGTRDLYPELLAPIRRIFDVWRSVSIRHGFLEYEGPTLEMLELYREKSGDELVGQLFRLTDAGGRELALRPEMTPTLARMVAARINALPKPIKWFSIPTLFRGENVQRGRLREFYQWNIDVIGAAEPAADAECILVGIEALRELGLTASDFCVHVSNRRLVSAMLEAVKIPKDAHSRAFALMDKASSMPEADFAKVWDAAFSEHLPADRLRAVMSVPNPVLLKSELGPAVGGGELEDAILQTSTVLSNLNDFGVGEYCRFDMHIVRGLAYYTGPVFEFYDRSQSERAICGGGRYDDLLGKLGKSREPAVGFGMGDVVLALLLEERGLSKPQRAEQVVFVANADPACRAHVYHIAAAIRRCGIPAEFLYTHQPLHKQMKAADKRGATTAIILGDESGSGGATAQIKDMKKGTQRSVSMEAILQDPRRALEGAP